MDRHELRDLDQARLFLQQGLWLQRALPITAQTVRPVLSWALELAAEGQPLPPVGMVGDLGHIAFGQDREIPGRARAERVAVPGLPTALLRAYEDHVLGKVYADWTFARAADALRHYQDRDRSRGLAFLIGQFRERARFAGVDLSPAVIKGLRVARPEEVLARGWESLSRDGLMPLLVRLYESLIAGARHTAEMLAPEDVFELEHRTALAEFGQRVALRQVLQAADTLEAALPRHRLRSSARHPDVPTRILDEDTYPVGGFASITTRGSIESLLHSQLAFMEKDQRPDLFDVKFLRDELLYYARDENQFLRRRRTFVFILFPDLVGTRFKDAGLPYQRGVLLLALLLAAVRKLAEWLSTDALTFEFLFLGEKEELLAPERELLEMLLREQLANGTVRVARLPTAEAAARHGALRSRRSLCHCLTISMTDRPLTAEDAVVTRLVLDGPCPSLHAEDEEPIPAPTDDLLEGWHAVLQRLLQRWL
ncbi:MAG TPA: hypothetical protein VNK04_16160 [Gemmataceae bacterium]|nr:hypothetical protein [Gemmataceae bacterium]